MWRSPPAIADDGGGEIERKGKRSEI